MVKVTWFTAQVYLYVFNSANTWRIIEAYCSADLSLFTWCMSSAHPGTRVIFADIFKFYLDSVFSVQDLDILISEVLAQDVGKVSNVKCYNHGIRF